MTAPFSESMPYTDKEDTTDYACPVSNLLQRVVREDYFMVLFGVIFYASMGRSCTYSCIVSYRVYHNIVLVLSNLRIDVT